jgi:flagellar protein FlbD
MISVTCRNGEHFSVDPDAIERVESSPDTVIILVDGGKYVVDEPFESVLLAVRDHRAAAFTARNRLVDGFAATPSAVRLGRRGRGHHDSPIVVLHGTADDDTLDDALDDDALDDEG